MIEEMLFYYHKNWGSWTHAKTSGILSFGLWGDSEKQALSPPLSQIKGKIRLTLLGEATLGAQRKLQLF